MDESTRIIVSGGAGAIASCVYFGGLWFTVKRLSRSSHPLTLYVASFLIRAALLMCGVFAMLQMGWQQGLAAFVGFLMVRYVLTLSLGLRKTHWASAHARRS